MSWLLPDPPQSGKIEDQKAYLALLRRLSPVTREVRDAIDEAAAALKEMERKKAAA